MLVGVLGVPADEESWSPRFRVYFKAVSQFHARQKDTELGILMVTNLSSFPSALTVIPVPEGDIRKHREDFIVNENLRRLGCSGRSGLTLTAPAGATQAKFHQLYRTSDRIPFYGAVIELVKLCQVALMMFGKLEQEYADGLLCDVTERAVNDWWTEVGSEYYNLEPSDGILGPTTVAALLGMLMGCRNRLNYYGAPVAKDVFDIACLKRGIAHFQKSQKLEKTRRFDRQTLNRLHRVTAKAAAGEGWAVPKAVKSTVAELSSKGGEMVMGMVGAKEKAGIGDVETLDMDQFVGLVHGERSKWLWHGKPRRSGTGETFDKSLPEMGNLIFNHDDQGGYVWTTGTQTPVPPEEDLSGRKKDSVNGIYLHRSTESTSSMIESPGEKDQHLRKTVFKSVTGKMSDARSGFGRIKDAVGLRGHATRHSKDEGSDTYGPMGTYFSPSNSTLGPPTGQTSTPGIEKAFTWKNKPQEYKDGYRRDRDRDRAAAVATVSHLRKSESPPRYVLGNAQSTVDPTIAEEAHKEEEAEAEEGWSSKAREIQDDLVVHDPSVAGSIYEEGDLEGPFLEAERDPQNFGSLLQRRHSMFDLPQPNGPRRNEAWWPRQLSFSEAEEAVLPWDDIGYLADDGDESDSWAALQKQKHLAEASCRLYARISDLQNQISTWVIAKVSNIEALESHANHNQEEFQTLHQQLSEAYQIVKQSSRDLLTEERAHITEAIKDVEVLSAKLEYEISALNSKVLDVEDGVAQFESQVIDVEARAEELGIQLMQEGWLRWLLRSVTGLGAANAGRA